LVEGSVVAYRGDRLEEIVAAEQGGLTEAEEALLDLLNRKPRRESSRRPRRAGPTGRQRP
jgi:hypothetical protein